MKLTKCRFTTPRKRTALLVALAICSLQIHGDPVIKRLTPPSALFSLNDPEPPIISRFLPGQRFDLQASVAPDPGRTITSVQFAVNGQAVAGTISQTPATVTGLPANTIVASLRAFSHSEPGIHTLTVTAHQSDGSVVTASGNFEVIPIQPTERAAKNIIILIGDGMGIAHRTAARIMKNGVALGKANAPLAMDTFPVTGTVTTHSLNSIVTDSSPGASCYATGNKANNNQHGVFPDDTVDNGDNPRIESIGEFLHRTEGRSLGIVSTTDLFDSTPGAFGSHTQARAAGSGICDEFFDGRAATGLTVLMGGGRKWFLPNSLPGSGRTAGTDYIVPGDVAAAWGVPVSAIDPARNLLQEFIDDGFAYVSDRTSLNAAGTPSKLLGLFNFSNMNVAKDKIDKRRNPAEPGVVDAYGFPDQPMLDEMAAKALSVLAQNPNGFVAMIEGGSIDKQAHLMDADRMVLDTIEFDRAIEVCRQFALQNRDTLVIVTADHECGGANIIGASRVTHANLVARAASGGGAAQLRNGVVGTLDQAAFPQYPILGDGYPATTDIDFKMLIGFACNADRFEDWLTNPLPLQNASHGIATPVLEGHPQTPLDRDRAGNYLVVGQIQDAIATHTASDIPLSALGRHAHLFTGVMDNTDVFFKIMRVALGDAKITQELHQQLNHP